MAGDAAAAGAAALTVTPDGWLRAAGRRLRCALGRAGITGEKREGDGATPVGTWPLRRVFWRPDRLDGAPAVGRSGLAVSALTPDLGWCDDPAHSDYNRLIRRPHPARHEILWRADGLYDVIVVLGYNDDPPAAGRGSAIFLHCALPTQGGDAALRPTAGCVALPRAVLLDVLADLPPGPCLAVRSAADAV
jgi:L,D-peptidoglycan transpeptidase YkuD (ErfK/YbiS/YcfS/YnhG family)